MKIWEHDLWEYGEQSDSTILDGRSIVEPLVTGLGRSLTENEICTLRWLATCADKSMLLSMRGIFESLSKKNDSDPYKKES